VSKLRVGLLCSGIISSFLPCSGRLHRFLAFFKTIKAELILRHPWETRRKVEIAIFEYINCFSNPRRRHSAPGWKSPVSFERNLA